MNYELTLHTRKKSYIVTWILLLISTVAAVGYIFSFGFVSFSFVTILEIGTPASILVALYYISHGNTEKGTSNLVIWLWASVIAVLSYFIIVLFSPYLLITFILNIVACLLITLVQFTYVKKKSLLVLIASIIYLLVGIIYLAYYGSGIIMLLAEGETTLIIPFIVYLVYQSCYFAGLFVLFFFNIYLENKKQEKLSSFYR